MRLNPLRLLIGQGGQRAIGIGTVLHIPMLGPVPVSLGISGFHERGELKEIAEDLYEQVMEIDRDWDKLANIHNYDDADIDNNKLGERPETPIPDSFKKAFKEEDGSS